MRVTKATTIEFIWSNKCTKNQASVGLYYEKHEHNGLTSTKLNTVESTPHSKYATRQYFANLTINCCNFTMLF